MDLYIFDLDGTLISSFMNEPGQPYNKWHLLPGRRERLHAIMADGDTIAIATNQAGVAFGHVSEQAAHRKIAAVIAALGLPATTPVAVCFAHPKSKLYRYRWPEALARRKPSGAMLRELVAAADSPRHVIYVGDSDDDKRAARDARVSFHWADDFFADMSLDPATGAQGHLVFAKSLVQMTSAVGCSSPRPPGTLWVREGLGVRVDPATETMRDGSPTMDDL